MFVLVNLKAYPSDPVAVAEAAAAVAADTGVRIAVAPQAAHIAAVADVGVETWAQHVSSVEHGSHTGSTLAEAVADAGAVGTLINHSERRRKLADIDGSPRAAERAGLETVVCANNPRQVAAATALEPDAVAVEPPALIGPSRPVSQADPAVVTDSIEAAGAIGLHSSTRSPDPAVATRPDQASGQAPTSSSSASVSAASTSGSWAGGSTSWTNDASTRWTIRARSSSVGPAVASGSPTRSATSDESAYRWRPRAACSTTPSRRSARLTA
ncbi:hypothetical protein BRC75_09575 [Halobacteriales archaeon QH_7_69_31]|nr:MAG: hypothetical protein BRC75_09575 [Halobacteriales archaeon QH_7_69_31]